ncbi:ORF4 [Leucania separata nucleopolyhedrovirus]|uniref:ORF4 n=1 Tax=Leucania separata nucleopolyhedrovirus TaxID=1307956 RepID=Q0ILB5_NPVLS|nr:ORF4 [Leucania separata nucleopolyhedrovirus]AAR28768.1 ORF4 [Leucania separata nucleopolyhedrovirus]
MNFVEKIIYTDWLRYRTYCALSQFNNLSAEQFLTATAQPFSTVSSELHSKMQALAGQLDDIEQCYFGLVRRSEIEPRLYESVPEKMKINAGNVIKDYVQDNVLKLEVCNWFMFGLFKYFKDTHNIKQFKRMINSYITLMDQPEELAEHERYIRALIHYFDLNLDRHHLVLDTYNDDVSTEIKRLTVIREDIETKMSKLVIKD